MPPSAFRDPAFCEEFPKDVFNAFHRKVVSDGGTALGMINKIIRMFEMKVYDHISPQSIPKAW
jgi:hypothetical protein